MIVGVECRSGCTIVFEYGFFRFDIGKFFLELNEDKFIVLSKNTIIPMIAYVDQRWALRNPVGYQ